MMGVIMDKIKEFEQQLGRIEKRLEYLIKKLDDLNLKLRNLRGDENE